MNQMEAAGAGFEIVDDLLQIMERHPLDDFGMPGAMVHFVEKMIRDSAREFVDFQKKSQRG